jgi:hypothetical protein
VSRSRGRRSSSSSSGDKAKQARVYNGFRDLKVRALKLNAPHYVLATLDVLDVRRKALFHDRQWVLCGYGGQPRVSGAPPPRRGMVEELELAAPVGGRRHRFSRRSFIRGIKWLLDHGLIVRNPGGGLRVQPIRQPNRAGRPQVAEYCCAVGGRGPDGQGLANGYAPAGSSPAVATVPGGSVDVDVDDQVGDVDRERGRAVLREATERLSRPRDGP